MIESRISKVIFFLSFYLHIHSFIMFMYSFTHLFIYYYFYLFIFFYLFFLGGGGWGVGVVVYTKWSGKKIKGFRQSHLDSDQRLAISLRNYVPLLLYN